MPRQTLHKRQSALREPWLDEPTPSLLLSQESARLAAYMGLLLVVSANCVALFLLSLLLAGGEGRADGMKAAWVVGYPWIAMFSIAALVLLRRGSRSWLAVAVGTLPAAWAAGLLVIVGANLLGFHVG